MLFRSANSDLSDLWVITKKGVVYLINSELENASGFPLITDEIPSSNGSVLNKALVFPTENNLITVIHDSGNITKIQIPAFGNLLSPPTVSGDMAAIYAKSFMGEIYFFNDRQCTNSQSPLEVDGIAFGSPALLLEGKSIYTGFINQAGLFYLWKDSVLLDSFPIQLDGVFHTNVVSDNFYFYALDSNANIYRISIDGDVLSVKIPRYTAKDGLITIFDYNKDKNDEIFVTIDGNLIYGFNSNLELLPSFPHVGYGKPVFIDLNGDKTTEIISITTDNKITAWKLEQ